jgi:hypothetical protein
MKKFAIIIFLIIIILPQTKLHCQVFVPLSADYNRVMDAWAIQNNSNFETSVKPVYMHLLGNYVSTDSLFSFGTKKPSTKKNWVIRKMLYENFLSADTTGFQISVDPLFNIEYEMDYKNGSRYYTNTRGIRLFGSLGNDLYFESSYYENGAKFPGYLSDYVNSNLIVPGQGAIRSENYFDYANATGILHYNYNNYLCFTLGHGKFFVGDGYRSVLLSDNSFNFPFFSIDVKTGKISYSRVMAELMSDSTPPGIDYGVREKKLAGFNILTYMPVNWFHIYFFEGNIWQYPNSAKNINFNYNFLDPIIYANALVSNPDFKTLIGAGFKLNAFRALQLYGQFAADKLNNSNDYKNHFAWQAGFKYCDVFTIKNLFLQIEFNTAKPKTYTDDQKILDYSHYLQAIANPLGTNFNEWVYILHYNFNRINFDLKFNRSEYGNKAVAPKNKNKKYILNYNFSSPFLGSGPYTDLKYLDYKIAFLLNPKTNLRIEAGCIARDSKVENRNINSLYFYFGLKTSLVNWYYDF